MALKPDIIFDSSSLRGKEQAKYSITNSLQILIILEPNRTSLLLLILLILSLDFTFESIFKHRCDNIKREEEEVLILFWKQEEKEFKQNGSLTLIRGVSIKAMSFFLIS